MGESWYWDWLVRNAARFHFEQNTRINEPWHWQYFGGRAAGPSVPPGQPGTVRPVSSPRNFFTVNQVPVLAGYRGRPPALVIGGNAVGRQTKTVDIIVHFHEAACVARGLWVSLN